MNSQTFVENEIPNKAALFLQSPASLPGDCAYRGTAMDTNEMKTMCDILDDVSKALKSVEMRSRSREIPNGSVADLQLDTAEALLSLQNQFTYTIRKMLEEDAFFSQVLAVPGVGARTLGRIAAHVEIEKANTVSALWGYCGYGNNIDGTAQRRKRGAPLGFEAKLKTSVFLLSLALVQYNDGYRKIYWEAREKYDVSTSTKKHSSMRSYRIVAKMFLSHLWAKWREFEQLPVTEPYIFVGNPNVRNFVSPEECQWHHQ